MMEGVSATCVNFTLSTFWRYFFYKEVENAHLEENSSIVFLVKTKEILFVKLAYENPGDQICESNQ